MNVLFCYFVKSDASTVAYTGQVTFYKVPEQHCFYQSNSLYQNKYHSSFMESLSMIVPV